MDLNKVKQQLSNIIEITKSDVKKYKKTHTKNIGDYRASKCVVIPIKEIFNERCYSL